MLEDYFSSDGSGFQSITYPNEWKKAGISEEEYAEEYESVREFLAEK